MNQDELVAELKEVIGDDWNHLWDMFVSHRKARLLALFATAMNLLKEKEINRISVTRFYVDLLYLTDQMID